MKRTILTSHDIGLFEDVVMLVNGRVDVGIYVFVNVPRYVLIHPGEVNEQFPVNIAL